MDSLSGMFRALEESHTSDDLAVWSDFCKEQDRDDLAAALLTCREYGVFPRDCTGFEIPGIAWVWYCACPLPSAPQHSLPKNLFDLLEGFTSVPGASGIKSTPTLRESLEDLAWAVFLLDFMQNP